METKLGGGRAVVQNKFSSNLVAKIEGHNGEDFAIRVPPPVRRYFLASLAASF